MLAGVSVDSYTRLERGNAHGASDTVLEALARALQPDEAERAHLFDLVHAASLHGAGASPPRPAAGAPERAAHPGPDNHHAGLRVERAPGHPGREPAATLEAPGSASGQPGQAH